VSQPSFIPPTNAPRDAHRAADWAGGIVSRQLDNTLAWARINTGSYNAAGLAALAPRLADASARLPGELTLTPPLTYERMLANGTVETVSSGSAVLTTVRPDAPLQVVLTGHYDTVFPADSAFQAVTSLPNGMLNGPGLADMKGGIAVAMGALEAFEALAGPERDRLGYQIVLNPDEEIGSPASAAILLAVGAKAHVGFTYEPAQEDDSLTRARKGSANWSLAVHGRSAHAGRDHASGRSAVLAAAAFVVELEALNGQCEGVTFNTGKIEGGSPVNQVPDIAVVRFNVRAPDAAAMDWASDQVWRLAAAVNRKDGLHAHLHGGVTRPPKPVNPQQEALMQFVGSAGRDLGLPIRWKDSGGVCDGNNLAAAGCPNIDTLGVRGGRIHSADEFFDPSSLHDRIALSTLLLLRLAKGEVDRAALRVR
jgi:glutamate carboxypeptidase